MAYNCYLFGELMPITPGELDVKIKGKNTTLTLLNEGEVSILKLPGLTEITCRLTIPVLTGAHSAEYYLGLFEKAVVDKTPTQFILTRTAPNGRLLFDTNLKVSVEDYTVSESAERGFDLTVEVKLKQYREYGTKTVSLEEADSGADNGSGSGGGAAAGSIAVGDTVRIVEGAVYGGAVPRIRGMKVPICYIGKWYTVSKLQTNLGEPEAIVKELNSWVAIRYLKKRGASSGGSEVITVEQERETTNAPSATTHTIKKGDTLWGIAKKYYGSGAQYTRIVEANRDVISDPNNVPIGTVLTIP